MSKISALPELTTPANDDELEIVDKSDLSQAATGTNKRMTWLTTITKIFASRFAADAGSTDTYVVTLDPAPAAYVTGEHYRFKANTANTGVCTVNFNGLGAKTIKKAAGGITTDLADNDIRAGQWVDLVYDGTNMQMQSLLGNAPAAGLSGSTGATDNALLRADGAGGSTVQASAITVDDDGAITIPEITAPATPAAGKVVVYAKGDNKVYRKGEDGVEAELGGTASIAPLEIVDANTVRQINGANPQTFQIFTNATLKYEFNGSEFIPPTGAPNHGSTTNRWGVSHANQFNAPSGGLFRFQGKSQIECTGTDGWIVIKPNAGSAMKISLGDTATAAVMIKRNGTTVEARKGDDSDYGEFGAAKYFYGDKANNVFDGFGSGTPEGVVAAAVGSTYRRTDGGAGTSFYVKESGTGNTGWVAK